jgi:hypothetical protein
MPTDREIARLCAQPQRGSGGACSTARVIANKLHILYAIYTLLFRCTRSRWSALIILQFDQGLLYCYPEQPGGVGTGLEAQQGSRSGCRYILCGESRMEYTGWYAWYQTEPEVGPTSAFYSCIPPGIHGPTCIFWATLAPFSPRGCATIRAHKSHERFS